jgi:hypothetical protein
MKRLLIAICSVGLATVLNSAQSEDSKETEKAAPTPSEQKAEPADQKSADRKRPALTEEQKNARKALVAKYDENKDGKLDPEERQKISAEDKAKLKKTGLHSRVRKVVKKG